MQWDALFLKLLTVKMPFLLWVLENLNLPGANMRPPIASCADYPEDGNKVVPSLKEALVRCRN